MINCSSLKTVQTILLTRLLYYTHTVLGQTQVLGNQQELLLFPPVTRRTIRITATKIMDRCYKPGIWHIDCLAVTCSSYHSCVATNQIRLYSCTVSSNNTVQFILTSRRGTPCFYYSALVCYKLCDTVLKLVGKQLQEFYGKCGRRAMIIIIKLGNNNFNPPSSNCLSQLLRVHGKVPPLDPCPTPYGGGTDPPHLEFRVDISAGGISYVTYGQALIQDDSV